jgi:imidazolonepropionase-like amidohydrolase
MMRESDGIHLITGLINAKKALQAGITTIREAGARNKIAHWLKEGWEKGLTRSPRLFISGRPLTITGGHFHFCNDNEADGADEVRKKVRQFVKEGIHFLKIMASGGGTAGTYSIQPSYNLDELKAAVEEAHKFDITTMAHCIAYESCINAAQAGVDIITHCSFSMPDGSQKIDKETVKKMIEKNLYYGPTLSPGVNLQDALMAKKELGEKLTVGEMETLERGYERKKRKLKHFKKLTEMGVSVVASSDGIGLGESTRLLRELELMVEGGMSPMETIVSATYNGAKALNMDHIFGTIQEGLKADIIAVKGDPTQNISDLRSIKMVMQNGEFILQY